MRKMFLGLALSLAVMSGLYSTPGKANGAIIVLLLRMLPDDYSVAPAYEDYEFSKSYLSDVLESSQDNVYVLRVYPEVFSAANYYAQGGRGVALTLADSNTVTFHYYPNLQALVGKAEGYDYVFVLETLKSDTPGAHQAIKVPN